MLSVCRAPPSALGALHAPRTVLTRVCVCVLRVLRAPHALRVLQTALFARRARVAYAACAAFAVHVTDFACDASALAPLDCAGLRLFIKYLSIELYLERVLHELSVFVRCACFADCVCAPCGPHSARASRTPRACALRLPPRRSSDNMQTLYRGHTCSKS